MPAAGFLSDYLSVITGRGRCDGWIELRYRYDAGMRSRFHRARGSHHALAQAVSRNADTRDVYIGCALRATQRGGREHIGQAWTVWAECDGQAAREALDAFATPPTLLVASGIIRSDRLRSGCGWAVCRWRHVVSEADRMEGRQP